jgi:hypothetical protein
VGVIHDVVAHLNGEQPLLCDVKTLPTTVDTCLVATNLRYVDGRKPTFIDHADSWFVIPLHLIRFVEVPLVEVARADGSGLLALPAGPDRGSDDRNGLDDEADADLLRRIRET